MIKYFEIRIYTEIGERIGKLKLVNDENCIGWIDILSCKVRILCEWYSPMSCKISGDIQSLKNIIPFEAKCEINDDDVDIIMYLKGSKIEGSGKEVLNG